MRKNFVFGLLLLPLFIFSQKISSSKWQDLFSYNNVLSIRQDGDRLIAATENGLFYYSPTSGEITKLSKANGLHEVKISAFDYNSETHTGLVGYESGAMDVITPDGITYIVDVPISGGYQGDKRINHISITGAQAVVSVGYTEGETATAYALAIFNFDKKEFGQSVIMSEPSKEAVIKGNEVFTVTNSGLRSHKIDNLFAIYPGNWHQIPGTFSNIAVEKDLIAYASGSSVYYGSNQASVGGTIKDITISDQNIAVTYDANGKGAVTIINTNETQQFSENLNTALYTNGRIYAGSQSSGILATSPGYSFPQNPANIKSYKPDGPYNNRSYKLYKIGEEIWISSGTYYGFKAVGLGYYHFNGKEWIYPDYFKLNPDNQQFNVLDLAINPSDTKELFFTNAISGSDDKGVVSKGIFKMYSDRKEKKYSEDGSEYYKIPVNIAFDKNNQLFSSLQYSEIGSDKEIAIQYYDKSGDKFVSYPSIQTKSVINMNINDEIIYINSSDDDDGSMVLYRYNKTLTSADDKVKLLTDKNNLPKKDGTISNSIDINGDLWIGGVQGLRILSNPTAAVDQESPQTTSIVITQNGVPEELFRDNAILSIAVDSGNQKWISVDDGGVYYLSANGENTYNHFTKANSPLPTNKVTDIKINDKTGEVYFVTQDGVVIYKGDVNNVSENFSNVMVYPNPVVYANYKGNVHLKGLAEKTNIRITDAAGNLVHQGIARGGIYDWDLTNKGKRVASGIYFVLMTNADGTDKATAKIAVVN